MNVKFDSEKYHVAASLFSDAEFVPSVVVALNHKVTLVMIL
jgi:hypothetical protein